MPGVFESSDLFEILFNRRKARRSAASPRLRLGTHGLLLLGGTAMVIIPPLFPPQIAAFLFGFVWIGFIPLLDTLNDLLGAPSLRRQIEAGDFARLWALLAGGMACGFLWEAWNYQAFLADGAFWIYTVPQPLRIFGLHFGKMPLLGLLGFPPFAVELHAFYVFLQHALGVDKLLK